MFNIEEKIKKWYENQKNQPIVKMEKDNEEVIYTTSNKNSSEIRDINELKNEIVKNQRQYDKLKEEIVYEFEKNPENDYSDDSLEKRADNYAYNEYITSYTKEEVKNKDALNDLEYKGSQIVSNSKEKQSKIEDDYDKILSDTTDKAIKNGISRSSILDGEIEKHLGDKESEIDLLLSNTQTAVLSNENQKEIENLRHENALKELDKEKDVIKAKKLESLKEERQKLVSQGILTGEYKFNENYKSPEMVEIRKSIINDVLNYFMSMDKKLAKRQYENDTQLQKLLGDLEPTIRTYLTGKGYYYQ